MKDRRLRKLEEKLGRGPVEKGTGSAYATIQSFMTWWLQPINVDRFDEKLAECWPQWLQRFGEDAVEAAIDELIAEGEKAIEGDTLAMAARDRAGNPSAFVLRIGGVDLENEL